MTATAEPGPGGNASQEAAGTGQAAPGRHQSLINAAARLRSGRRRSFPIETFLLVAGALLLPIGIIVIVVGWYGAAHTFHTYEQNDYLISGGLLGLGLVFTGGFLYFGYWMTRQIRTSTAANQQMLNALGRIETQLGAGANGKHPVAPLPIPGPAKRAAGPKARSGGAVDAGERGSGASAPGGGAGQGQAAAGTRTLTLVATERGNLLHRPDCPVVANKENLRTVSPDEPGYRPCQICSPLDGD